MLPITPLMVEHRIIERMIEIAKKELDNFKITNKLNVAFIDNILEIFLVFQREIGGVSLVLSFVG